jgi:hypothetical protein
MSMRMISCVGALAIGAGCPGWRTSEGEHAQNLQPPPALVICPDGTTNCTNPNGTGIYTAERGAAGIGPNQLMITHFINLPGGTPTSSRVAFDGRFFDPQAQTWGRLPAPGLVVRADYQGKHELTVLAVSETSTALQWTLLDPQTSQPMPVPDSGLASLVVYVQFSLRRATNDTTQIYALRFQPTAGGPASKLPLQIYDLTWQDTRAPQAPARYCADAQGNTDPVVFQRGMDVEPITGSVARGGASPSFVTMSCRGGALATVYSWGYGYGAASSTPTFYFDAGIQMKRASYCGDAQFFTVANTNIYMTDDQGIQPAKPPPHRIEAWWTPTGASCVNLANLRHSSMGFQGSCKGVPLPACPPALPGAPYLGDAPQHPGP